MIRRDCFAFKEGEKAETIRKFGKEFCSALNDLDCNRCRFYKTKEEAEAGRRKSRHRREKLGLPLTDFDIQDLQKGRRKI